jgi:hypothetical protein
MPTVAAVMGANVRRLRGGHTAEQLAHAAEAVGLRWSTGRISELENGKMAATITTVYLVTLALSHLLGRAVPTAELFAGDGDVTVPGGPEIELEALRSMFGDRRKMAGPPLSRVAVEWQRDAAGDAFAELGPLVKAGVGPIRDTYIAMTETDIRIGNSLGWSRLRTAAEMANRWGHPLSVERDRWSPPGVGAQARGQLSRALKNQLRGEAE